MTWIYTITFLGLLFANGGTGVEHPTMQVQTTPTIIAESESSVLTFDEKENFDQTYPFSSEGSVKISNINGSITLKAWDRNEIQLSAVKSAKTKEELADLEIKIDADQNNFQIEAGYKRGQWRGSKEEIGSNSRIDMTLSVPKNAILDEIGTVNGRIDLSGFFNRTKVSAVNGEVTARDLRGSADLSTVNGIVTAEFERIGSGDRISLNTVNGEAKLIIPSDSDATIRANSLNGNIANDFGLPVSKGQFVGRDLSGRLGNGEAQLKLNSVNGDLAILRKKDGKNPKAAVNTLSEARPFGPEIADRLVDTAKIDREIAKASADAQKEAQEAFKLAQVELADKLSSKEFMKLKNSKDLMKLKKFNFEFDKNAFKRSFNWSRGVPKISRKERSFTVNGKTKVVIDAPGCDVNVKGWDKNEVRYVVSRLGGQSSDDQMKIIDSQDVGTVNIKIDSNDLDFADFDAVRVVVFVPKNSDLDITTEDEIRLEGVSGELKIQGGDGDVNVRDSSGNLKLSTDDGQVRIVGFKGGLDSTTGDGDVYLEGDFATLNSNSVDGNVTLTLSKNFSGTISSNSEIENKGIDLTKENDGQWRKGTGENVYKFSFSDGKLTVLDAASLGSMN